jgi:hypothetical protein
VGENSIPFVLDWNNDHLNDLLIGNRDGQLQRWHGVELANLRTIKYRYGDPPPGFQFLGHLFESWMEVLVENLGKGDAFNVKATITDQPASFTIIDGEVTVGDIPAGSSAWSTDTFKLQVDLNIPTDPNEGIVWRIEYHDRQGNHHVIEDVPQFP